MTGASLRRGAARQDLVQRVHLALVDGQAVALADANQQRFCGGAHSAASRSQVTFRRPWVVPAPWGRACPMFHFGETRLHPPGDRVNGWISPGRANRSPNPPGRSIVRTRIDGQGAHDRIQPRNTVLPSSRATT